jgi:hypothetical protein
MEKGRRIWSAFQLGRPFRIECGPRTARSGAQTTGPQVLLGIIAALDSADGRAFPGETAMQLQRLLRQTRLFCPGCQETLHEKREEPSEPDSRHTPGIPGSWSLSRVALVIHVAEPRTQETRCATTKAILSPLCKGHWMRSSCGILASLSPHSRQRSQLLFSNRRMSLKGTGKAEDDGAPFR